jgi:hypothetical protein
MKYFDTIAQHFDATKTNVEIAKEIRESGDWELSDARGRKVVGEYRIALQQVKEPIHNFEELLKNVNVDPSKFSISSARIEKGKSEKIGLSLSLKKNVDTVDYLSEVKELLASYQPHVRTPVIINAPVAQKDNLLVIPIFDLHFGKSNIDTSYSLETAKGEYLDVVTEIASSAYYRDSVSDCLLVFGGDLLNTDNAHYTTTKGTPQVTDGNSYQSVFRTACEAIIQSISILEGIFDTIHIINTPGNHDQLSSFMLFEVVAAFFRTSDRISIDNSEASRKYFSYGENVFQVAHGHKAVDRLPLLFSRECSEFSQRKFPMILLGHTHHAEKKHFLGANEYTGITMRVFNSIAKADAYHEQEGFSESIRQMEGLIFSKRKGKIGEITRIL